MKSFPKYIDAENYAKKVSASQLKSISIVHLPVGKNWKAGYSRDFTVMDTKDEWHWGIEYVMCITNFESPFEVNYISPKAGRVTEYFPTKERQETRYNELVAEKFRKDICKRDLSSEQYFNECVKPYEWSKQISNEHRQTLIN